MTRPAIYAFLLAALVIVCATVLLLANHDVPEAFWIIAAGSAGGGAGIAVPTHTHRSSR
jgi:hypothetical protein